MLTLTRWVLSHKRTVAGLWLAITIVAFAAVQPAGKALSQQFPLPGQEGYEVNRQLVESYGNGGDIAPLVPVVTLRAGKKVDAQVTRQFAAALERVQRAVPGSRITHNPAFVSDDGRTTFALMYIRSKGGTDPGQAEARQAQAALRSVEAGGSRVRVTGLDALRASAGETDGSGTGVLIETLLAGLVELLTETGHVPQFATPGNLVATVSTVSRRPPHDPDARGLTAATSWRGPVGTSSLARAAGAHPRAAYEVTSCSCLA